MLYPLDGILLSSLCGVVSGCGSFVDVALYGEEKSGFLRKLATFEHGIPSRDTLSTVFRALDPEEFNAAFAAWASGLAGRVGGTVVAIDGKTARGSRAGGETPLHLIPAWCNDLRLVPGQQAGAHKKNGIKDIPVLLDLLFPEGAVVTLDAMGCQRGIACKIRDKGADYVPALKGNQGLLHEDVKLWFEEQDQENTESLQTVDGDRGRIETRTYTQCDAIGRLKKRHPHREGLVSIGRVVPLRESGGRRHGKRGTSSRPCQKTPRALPMPYALTGELKTASTGCLMSPSAMTTAGYEKIMHLPASPSSGTSQ